MIAFLIVSVAQAAQWPLTWEHNNVTFTAFMPSGDEYKVNFDFGSFEKLYKYYGNPFQ